MTAPVLHWPKLFDGLVCPRGEPALNGSGDGDGWGYGDSWGNESGDGEGCGYGWLGDEGNGGSE